MTNPPFLFHVLSLNRIPTLFKELSVSPTSSKKEGASRGNFSPDVQDLDDEASPLMDQQLSRADRLRSFSEVVEEVTSRDKRDKAVKKAAKKFLMAAHHDKLYPPAMVYQVRKLKNKLWSKRVPDFCLSFALCCPHRFSLVSPKADQKSLTRVTHSSSTISR